MSANNRQVGGNHYRTGRGGIQHWDLATARNYDYFQGQITKYVDRWKEKNGITDLEKAAHFLQKYIENEKYKLEDSAHKQEQNQKQYALDLPISETIGSLKCQYSGQRNPFGYEESEEQK